MRADGYDMRASQGRFDASSLRDSAVLVIANASGSARLQVFGINLPIGHEGDRGARTTFLCLHGQPSWAYLYRKMIPIFLDAGHRVVAPDLIGFWDADLSTPLSVVDDFITLAMKRPEIEVILGSRVMLMGRDIRAGEYLQAATPADIAPTLAFLCGMTLAPADGRVLAEALRLRPAQPPRPPDEDQGNDGPADKEPGKGSGS